MKSVFLSFVIFIVVFTALHFNILGLIDNNVFHIIAPTVFIIVMACGVYFVGLPKIQLPKKEDNPQQKEEQNEEK